jgi:hypothetical protein
MARITRVVSLQDVDDQVQAGGGAEQARQDEEGGPALVGAAPEADVQIVVDRGQLEPVVQRQQDVGDGDVADHVADQDLAVAEAVVTDRAGHADEGGARQGGADHAEGDQHPVAALVTDKETVVVGVAGSGPGDPEQQGEVGDQDAKK